jgi:hypothetical protein
MCFWNFIHIRICFWNLFGFRICFWNFCSNFKFGVENCVHIRICFLLFQISNFFLILKLFLKILVIFWICIWIFSWFRICFWNFCYDLKIVFEFFQILNLFLKILFWFFICFEFLFIFKFVFEFCSDFEFVFEFCLDFEFVFELLLSNFSFFWTCCLASIKNFLKWYERGTKKLIQAIVDTRERIGKKLRRRVKQSEEGVGAWRRETANTRRARNSQEKSGRAKQSTDVWASETINTRCAKGYAVVQYLGRPNLREGVCGSSAPRRRRRRRGAPFETW